MSYAAAALTLLLAASAATAICLLVQKFVPIPARERHHEIGTAVFLQLGVLFAVLLAFVFSEAYSEFGEAERAMNLECGALHAAAMLSSTLPPAQARDTLTLELHYIDDVVQHEWPDLQRRRAGDGVSAMTLRDLIRHVSRVEPATASDSTVKAELLSLLAEAHAQREIRLYQATKGLPNVLWLALIVMAIILTIFVSFAGIQSVSSLSIFAVIFAVNTTAALVLVRLLDYPFEGALGLTPRDFVETAQKVAALLSGI